MGGDETRLGPGELEEQIGYQLRLAQLASYRAFEGRLSRRGIAPRYLGLLAIVATHPGQPQSRLAEAIAIGRSSLVAIIDRLEQDGLVRRESSAKDRRFKGVWMTAKGERIVRGLISEAWRHEEEMARGLSVEERQILVRSLATICRNLGTPDEEL